MASYYDREKKERVTYDVERCAVACWICDCDRCDLYGTSLHNDDNDCVSELLHGLRNTISNLKSTIRSNEINLERQVVNTKAKTMDVVKRRLINMGFDEESIKGAFNFDISED